MSRKCAVATFMALLVTTTLFAQDAKTVAKRLAQEHDLIVLPGSMFGPCQEQYLRLAFANVEAEVMPDVVARLIESQK